MKSILLKLEDDLLKETELLLDGINKSRNRYINEALHYYNRIQKRKMLANMLKNESKMVADESMKVLAEFEKLEILDDEAV
jgi:predicted PolB exonuclease-like 3'-5' exonuclease